MSPAQTNLRGMYFEEFEEGMEIVSIGRTVTEADIVAFAGLSGDFNQIHMDAEFAANSPAGQRVAHGMLGASIASGLAVQTGVLEGTIMYFREINSWKFVKPILIGDTIHVKMTIQECKPMSRLGAGQIKIGMTVYNQHDDTVMKGIWLVLMLNTPEE